MRLILALFIPEAEFNAYQNKILLGIITLLIGILILGVGVFLYVKSQKGKETGGAG